MRRILIIALSLVAAALLLVAAVAVGLFWAAHHEPTFYRQAIRSRTGREKAAGDEMETRVLELHNDARKTGSWQAVFTQEQINGWLAAELPEKFPGLLPPGLKDPLVAIEEGRARVAVRYEDDRLATVLSCVVEVHLAHEPDTLALRFRRLRAGALPLPLGPFVERATAAARRAHVRLRWSQAGGDPVALVTLPTQHRQFPARHIHVDTIELRSQELLVSGHTEHGENSSPVD